MASVKIQNVELIEMNTYEVTYITGTVKYYQTNKAPKTVLAWLAAHEEPEPATEEPARIETVETTEGPATAEQETIKTEEPKQELENIPVLNLDGTRRTGWIIWDVTQHIFLPLAGLLLTVAAHGVEYLARLAYMLATFAGWMEPKYNRAVAMVRATAGRIRNTANTALETVKQETPVILETVRTYTVAALEFRREIIALDKYQEEF